MFIDTFSAHSLKILDRSLEEFENRFIYNLYLSKKDKRAILGQKYHNLICAYLKGYDISKMKQELENKEVFEKFLNTIKDKENFIKTEYSFLIKNELKERFYYIVGRFDALYLKNDEYTIYDWKTLTVPKNAQDDLQSIVYLYALSKIFNTKKIKMRYISIETLKFEDVEYSDEKIYKNRIDKIVEKYFKSVDEI